MKIKPLYFRFRPIVDGKKCRGQWLPYNEKSILKYAKQYIQDGRTFTVEFNIKS